MRDIDKALLGIPPLAIAMGILLAVNSNPSLLTEFFAGEQPLRSEISRNKEPIFDLVPYQRPPSFPD